MKKIIEGLKNGKLLIPLVIVVFLAITIPGQLQQNEDKLHIKKYRKLSLATTYDCIKNIRSSMHDVYYKFSFREKEYKGSVSFNKREQGNICDGYRFLVEFDSTNPSNNHLLLDSIR